MNHFFYATFAALIYLIVSSLLIGFKSDQIALAAIFLTLYFSSSISRKFILGFSIFIVFWIIFDFMKAFPNYYFNEVNIKDLYLIEKSLFGIQYDGKLLTPNEYLDIHSVVWADVLSGLFYLSWIPLPLAFAAYLFFKNKTLFVAFSITFLMVNLLGFVIYYLYPAAPPWYVKEYGFIFNAHTMGNTANLSKFDIFFNVQIFHSLYQKSSNVFAAMPSLHSAYPLIVLNYGMKLKSRIIHVLFFTITIGIWFAAVYSGHHYILDVIAGIIVAFLGIYLYKFLYLHQSTFNYFINKYIQKIS